MTLERETPDNIGYYRENDERMRRRDTLRALLALPRPPVKVLDDPLVEITLNNGSTPSNLGDTASPVAEPERNGQ